MLPANKQDQSSSHEDTNGNTYSSIVDALKLIGKRCAGESLANLKAETLGES